MEIQNVQAITNQNVFSLFTSTLYIGGIDETLFENNQECVNCKDSSTVTLIGWGGTNIFRNNVSGIIAENMSLVKLYSNTSFDNNTTDVNPVIGIQGNRYSLIDIFNSGE
jgi:hypothetical protein